MTKEEARRERHNLTAPLRGWQVLTVHEGTRSHHHLTAPANNGDGLQQITGPISCPFVATLAAAAPAMRDLLMLWNASAYNEQDPQLRAQHDELRARTLRLLNVVRP